MTPARLACTVLGVGLLRPAPGTWGSLFALLAAFPILWIGGPGLLLASIAAAVLLGLWAIPRSKPSCLGLNDTPLEYFDETRQRWIPHRGVLEEEFEDPPEVVIDELAGQWVALLPVAFGAWSNGVAYGALWPGWVAAFVLFRLLDVWKPGPVGWADRRPGAWGVLLDDLIAGALAAVGVALLAGLSHGVLMR